MMVKLNDTIHQMSQQGEDFVVATVVRTLSVTAAKAGAKAIISSNGEIVEGWIGGGCARSAVIKAAKAALEDGEPKLISLKPEDLLDEEGVLAGDIQDGVHYAKNGCPSKGSMDIFVEPIQPTPELVILGASPVAVALNNLAPSAGFTCMVCAKENDLSLFSSQSKISEGFEVPEKGRQRRFCIVATQGAGDQLALKCALDSGSEWIAFVGSKRKMAVLAERLIDDGINADQVRAIKAPAGLDIKAVTPEEIVLSIVTELIQQRRTSQINPPS